MYGSGGNGLSLADIAAVTRNNNGNGDGFGNNGWWILVLLWAINGNGNLFGNRNNDGGNCGCGSSGGGSVTYQVGADVQRGFDTSTIIAKLDGLNNGLCSLGYDQLAQMNGINSTVQQTGFNIIQAIGQLGITGMQSTTAIRELIQSCCCGLEKQISDSQYAALLQNKDLTQLITQVAQNIMQNDNNNYRQLHDEIVATRMQDLKDQLAQKDTLINMLNLQSSQGQQTIDIVNQIMERLRTCPVGTYNVCNPQSGSSPLQQLVNALGNSNNCNCNSCVNGLSI